MMKVVGDPRPYKTFSVQISFDIGWRHEPIKMRGSMRKSLEELLEEIRSVVPKWFEVSYVMDSEFSSLLIFGTSADQNSLLKVPDVIEMNFPEVYRELNASVELVSFAGGVKKDIIEDFYELNMKSRFKPEIVSKPRRFLDLKGFSRVQKHFFSYIFLRREGEVFLEVSRRGDRIHYGKNIPDLDLSVDEEIKFYRAWILKKWESTMESAKLLTLMNIFSKEIIKLDEIFRELNDLDEKEFLKSLDLLKTASGR